MDFWEILDCEPTSDRRELKRAYARQLKQHPPEADPDAFQQLRHAYESLLAAIADDRAAGAVPGEAKIVPEAAPRAMRSEEPPPPPPWFDEALENLRFAGSGPRARVQVSAAVELSPAQTADRLARRVLESLSEVAADAGVEVLRAAHRETQTLHIDVEAAFEARLLAVVRGFPWHFWPGAFVREFCTLFRIRERAVSHPEHLHFLDLVERRTQESLRPLAERATAVMQQLRLCLRTRGEEEACGFLDFLLDGLKPGSAAWNALADAAIGAVPDLGAGAWPRVLMAHVVEAFDLAAERRGSPDAGVIAYIIERGRAAALRERLEDAAREPRSEGSDLSAEQLLSLSAQQLESLSGLPPGERREALRSLLRTIERECPAFWVFEWPMDRRTPLERIARHMASVSDAERTRRFCQAREFSLGMLKLGSGALAVSVLVLLHDRSPGLQRVLVFDAWVNACLAACTLLAWLHCALHVFVIPLAQLWRELSRMEWRPWIMAQLWLAVCAAAAARPWAGDGLQAGALAVLLLSAMMTFELRSLAFVAVIAAYGALMTRVSGMAEDFVGILAISCAWARIHVPVMTAIGGAISRRVDAIFSRGGALSAQSAERGPRREVWLYWVYGLSVVVNMLGLFVLIPFLLG